MPINTCKAQPKHISFLWFSAFISLHSLCLPSTDIPFPLYLILNVIKLFIFLHSRNCMNYIPFSDLFFIISLLDAVNCVDTTNEIGKWKIKECFYSLFIELMFFFSSFSLYLNSFFFSFYILFIFVEGIKNYKWMQKNIKKSIPNTIL